MDTKSDKPLTVVVSLQDKEKTQKWVSSIDQANEEVKRFEKDTLTKYNQRNNRSFNTAKGLIRWDSVYNFPFKISRVITLECQHAKDRNKTYNMKRRSQVDKTKRKHKPYITANPSKKTNCPAFVEILSAITFPDYSIPPNTKLHKRKLMSQTLRYDLALGIKDIRKEDLYRVTFPSAETHIGHGFGEVLPKSDQLDSRLVDKIEELATLGIITFKEIKNTLSFTVGEMFKQTSQPCTKHKRFWPTKKTICQHFIEACSRLGLIKYDKDGVMLLPDRLSTVNTIKDNVFAYCAKTTGTQIAITYYNWGPDTNKQVLACGETPVPCSEKDENEEDVIKKYLRF